MTDTTTSFAARNTAIVKDFAKRLNEVLDSFGYPRHYSGRYTLLAEKYGVSVQTSRKWCKGIGVPSPAVLVAMAHDFDTTIDALLGDQGLSHARPLPALQSAPIYELSNTAGGTQYTDFAQTGSIVTSSVPFIQGLHKGAITLIVNWADMEAPELHVGDVLFVDMDCHAIVESGTYVVRSPTMTTIRIGSVSLSDSVRFSKIDRAGAEEHTDIPVKRLSFNTDHDFLSPPPIGPGTLLVVGRVLGIHRSLNGNLRIRRKRG